MPPVAWLALSIVVWIVLVGIVLRCVHVGAQRPMPKPPVTPTDDDAWAWILSQSSRR